MHFQNILFCNCFLCLDVLIPKKPKVDKDILRKRESNLSSPRKTTGVTALFQL